MGYLTWWDFPRKAWMIILGELASIVFLSGWVYLQYLSDVYFQSYVNNLAPLLVPVLSIVFGICSASIATYLYVGMKKIRTLSEPQTHQRKKLSQEKRSIRHTPTSPSTIATSDPQPSTSAKLRPLAPVHTNNRAHKPSSKDSNDSTSTETPTPRKSNAHE